ncbi:unnamed protein product [Paramecium primaurelia]|uniref:CBM20 domain-containing protein n=1 Tax=Paramecium primaurelia TaxID=5886 RepID=A0A8S1KXY3_PARPR|nr:unnamed protein product [Paramecium primaurelia]
MIRLQIHYKTEFGQALYISGKSKYLGQWNPEQAIRMIWTQNNIWIAEVAYHMMEYKYFISQYDKVQKICWESGPNRVTNKHSIDVWNHRKIYFQCVNPQNFDIYISGSQISMGQFQRRVRMKNKDGMSQQKFVINIDDCQIQYQYHIVTKSEFSSPVYKVDLNCQQQYYKDALLIFSDGLTKLKQMIFQLNKNICYGYVPLENEDYQALKKANLKTIIEFCNTKEQSLLEQQTKYEDIVHLIVNLYHFKQENFAKRLLQLIQVLIQKYQLLYICNNSLTHLRKYLSVYEKLSFGPQK